MQREAAMEVSGSRRAKVRPGAAAWEQMDGRVFASRGDPSHGSDVEMAASTFRQLL